MAQENFRAEDGNKGTTEAAGAVPQAEDVKVLNDEVARALATKTDWIADASKDPENAGPDLDAAAKEADTEEDPKTEEPATKAASRRKKAADSDSDDK